MESAMNRLEELLAQGRTNYYCDDLNRLSKNIRDWRERKGFQTSTQNLPEKLLLVVSEISEAAEDLRAGLDETILNPEGKPCGFGSEMADALIRILDIADSVNIDLAREVAIKMAYNELRPHKHGKKF
jgi:NTP pyrophosphatase (non-canonical NTP hydrolase)